MITYLKEIIKIRDIRTASQVLHIINGSHLAKTTGYNGITFSYISQEREKCLTKTFYQHIIWADTLKLTRKSINKKLWTSLLTEFPSGIEYPKYYNKGGYENMPFGW